MQAAKRWRDAATLFLQVYNKVDDSDALKDGALEEHAWSILHNGEADAAITELQQVRDNLEDLDGNEEAKARVWWRLGECFWRSGGEYSLFNPEKIYLICISQVTPVTMRISTT